MCGQYFYRIDSPLIWLHFTFDYIYAVFYVNLCLDLHWVEQNKINWNDLLKFKLNLQNYTFSTHLPHKTYNFTCTKVLIRWHQLYMGKLITFMIILNFNTFISIMKHIHISWINGPILLLILSLSKCWRILSQPTYTDRHVFADKRAINLNTLALMPKLFFHTCILIP